MATPATCTRFTDEYQLYEELGKYAACAPSALRQPPPHPTPGAAGFPWPRLEPHVRSGQPEPSARSSARPEGKRALSLSPPAAVLRGPWRKCAPG